MPCPANLETSLPAAGEAASAPEGEPGRPVEQQRDRKPKAFSAKRRPPRQGRRPRARQEVCGGQDREGQGGLGGQVGEAPGGEGRVGR